MNHRIIKIAVLTMLITGLILVFPSCGKKKGGEIKPKHDSSFDDVTAQLNPRGSFYLYAGTDTLSAWVDDFFKALYGPEMDAMMKGGNAKTQTTLKWVHKMLKESGLLAIDGIGISTVPVDEHLHHSRFVINRAKRLPDDLMSLATDTPASALESLKLLPADTAFASFSDHALLKIWQWIENQIMASDIDDLSQGWSKMKTEMQAADIDPEKMLKSLGNQIGFIITLDENKTFNIPGKNNAVTLPVPGMALVIDTTDDSLFQLLKKHLPMAESMEKEGERSLTMPELPLGFAVKFYIHQSPDRLVITSTPDLFAAIRNASESGKGLIASDEFKTMSRHMPDKGDGFRFLSTRVMKLVSERVLKTQASDQPDPETAMGLNLFRRFFPENFSFYSVARHEGDQIIIAMNHSFPSSQMLLLPAVSTVGIVSAIAIPNIIKAREKAQVINEDLTQQPGDQAAEIPPEDPDEGSEVE